jgi:transposase
MSDHHTLTPVGPKKEHRLRAVPAWFQGQPATAITRLHEQNSMALPAVLERSDSYACYEVGHKTTQCTTPIHEALVHKNLPPSEHLVDAAYSAAELLVRSQEDHGIILRGPTRPNQSWQAQVEGGYRIEHFTVDWEHQQVHCPQGKTSVRWLESSASSRGPYIHVRFDPHDCGPCATRACCTRATQQPRTLQLQPQAQYAALDAARTWYASEEGQQGYKQRTGVEGTLSQGVRAFGLRQTRYRGLEKTHLQHVATAAAINVDRIVAWLEERPRATTRTARFAALAPALTLPAETPSV